MDNSDRAALSMIQSIVEVSDPTKALNKFLGRCTELVRESWTNYVRWRVLLLWGRNITDPEDEFYSLKQMEAIIGTNDVLSFLSMLLNQGVADRTVLMVVDTIKLRDRYDILVVGAVAAICAQFEYHHTIDPKAQEAARACMGYILGTSLEQALQEDI